METVSTLESHRDVTSIPDARRDNTIAISSSITGYPAEVPYNPSVEYPEYPFKGFVARQPNLVYDGVRRLFEQLGMDAQALGTPTWNPLGSIVEPGMTVVLKPNFVLSRHKEKKDLFAIITHPSVLRALIDYCWIALKGHGEVLVADAPQYDCNYQELLERTGLDKVCNFYAPFNGAQVGYLDLRKYWSPERHFPSMLRPLPGDPKGSIKINLGKTSALYDHANQENLYGAVYDREETFRHHHGEDHIYELSRTIMDADVVISVPKLKVHKKVGVTLNAKGLVGTATNKNLIVHYTLGTPGRGGDQFPDGLLGPVENLLIRSERWMYDHFLATPSRPLEYLHRSIYWLHNHTTKKLGIKVAEEKRQLDAGNWYGNDSAWRMTVDLMRVFYFADGEGQIHSTPQRRLFSVIDGVVGGEGCGPLTPDPHPAGILIGGANPIAADLIATRLMGFDPMKLKVYSSLLEDSLWDFGVRSLEDVKVVSDAPDLERSASQRGKYFGFKPHPGWVNHVELERGE
jgi:uncharacterized protein (DUF362 family)